MLLKIKTQQLLRRSLDESAARTFTRDKIDADFAATNGAVTADLTFDLLVGYIYSESLYKSRTG